MNPLSTIIPSVVEGNGGFERSYDIYSLLLKERIVFVGSQIDSQIANLVVAELLYLSREDPDRVQSEMSGGFIQRRCRALRRCASEYHAEYGHTAVYTGL